MGKLILSFIVVVLLLINGVFVTKFISLLKSLNQLKEEQEIFLKSGNDMKQQLQKLSILNDVVKKIAPTVSDNLFNSLSQKISAFQIAFVTYSQRDEEIEKGKKLKVLQFIFNELEMKKLFLLLVSIEKEFPGIIVKLVDIVMKDNKVAQKVVVEFIKTIVLEEANKS
ncbi:MAG: hypothetical protein ACK4NF_00070 [Planctomycetota bacterium]